MGRRSKIISGGSKASHNSMLMAVGFGGGIISDAVLYSLKIPGHNVKIASCDALTLGDIYEIVFFGFLTWIGVLYNRHDLSAFSYGLLAGKLFPTVITPAVPGVGRYIIFDLDRATGAIKPGLSVSDSVTTASDSVAKIPDITMDTGRTIRGIIDDGIPNVGTTGYAESNFVERRYF